MIKPKVGRYYLCIGEGMKWIQCEEVKENNAYYVRHGWEENRKITKEISKREINKRIKQLENQIKDLNNALKVY